MINGRFILLRLRRHLLRKLPCLPGLDGGHPKSRFTQGGLCALLPVSDESSYFLSLPPLPGGCLVDPLARHPSKAIPPNTTNFMRFPFSLTKSMTGYLMRQRLKGNTRFPLVLMLEPLHACNLRCAGCGRIREYADTVHQRMTVSECLDSVDECGAPDCECLRRRTAHLRRVDGIASGDIGSKETHLLVYQRRAFGGKGG